MEHSQSSAEAGEDEAIHKKGGGLSINAGYKLKLFGILAESNVVVCCYLGCQTDSNLNIMTYDISDG